MVCAWAPRGDGDLGIWMERRDRCEAELAGLAAKAVSAKSAQRPVARTNFGRELTKARLQKGLTQQQLARLLDTSASTISRYETGRFIPWDEFVTRCDELLDVHGLLQRLYQEMLQDRAE
jgi:ribosome-binding protein aMBF1 (putative translation factor)